MNRPTNKNKIKKFSIKMQAKLLLVFCILIIAMTGLIVRLVYINRSDGERYAKKVLSQQTYSSTVLPYQRGSILDRKGTVLATSEKVYNLILDAKNMLIKDDYLKPTIAALTECYESITTEAIMEIKENKSKSQYIILLKGLSYDEMMLFKNKADENDKIQGVWFEEDYVRTYPYNTLASDVIGFTSSGNVGNWGIEQFYNNELNGTNGREYGYIDSELKLERTVKAATNGNTIVSTIDANVQGIVQNHIKMFNEEYGSKNIAVLVMNPNNGEIIAMASNEEYDLNNPSDLSAFYSKDQIADMDQEEKLEILNTIWRNYVISDTFEPGSTFKPITIAAALEEAIISKADTFFCDGFELIGKWRIKCSKRTGHGELTLTEVLMKSCNDALMQIVAKEGKRLFYQYQNFFGFGSKTGIDLPGEAKGILVSEKDISVTDLAISSFGQTFTTTMVQLASAYSSIINGGYYYEPHMVKQIINEHGAIVKNIEKTLVRETVSSETSKFIKEAMYLTVAEGTAKGAQVSGYKVSGKTGTAEKYPRGDDTYLVSFIGNVPADNPEIVIYVLIDEPQNVIEQADSSLATKFASRILSEVLPFLELFPTEEVDGEIVTAKPILPSINGENTTNEETSEGNKTDESTLEETGDNSALGENSTKESNASQNSTDNSETSEDNSTEKDAFTLPEEEDSTEDEFNADAIPSNEEESVEN